MKAPSTGVTDLRRVFRAARYSLQGLRSAWNEPAFVQEVLLGVILAPLGLWLGDSAIERVLLVGSLVLVLIVELLNSAVEAAVDRIGPERHQLAGHAKDMGSAAVLLSIFLALMVWALILVPKLFYR